MIIFTDEQEKAIEKIVNWFKNEARHKKVFYLAGFAGTGKTTLVNEAVTRIREIPGRGSLDVKIAAFTGKAASVLRKKGVEAMTIHSLIYQPVEKDPPPQESGKDENLGLTQVHHDVDWIINEFGPAYEAGLIILDECSMIDDQMAQDLLSFGKPILVMGDPGQLPPVRGQGAFVNQEPDAFLQEIHRQALDSPILELATLARQGLPLPLNFSKGEVRVLDIDGNRKRIHDEGTQVIVGKHDTRYTVTKLMRDKLGFMTHEPAVSERIICTKNNKKCGFFNGMMATLLSKNIRRGGANESLFWYELGVKFEDLEFPVEDLDTDPVRFNMHFNGGKELKLPWKGFNEFDFSYAITCHKSQGSQFKHVTVVNDAASFRENAHRWLYTAITRAETGLTLLMR